MEQDKVTRPPMKVLSGLVWSVASKGFLDFIDIACVITCIWTVLWLIYFNFVKDFVEILVFAFFKYINRFRWLCRLLRSDRFLKRIVDFLETCELCYSQNIDNFPSEDMSSEMNVSISSRIKGFTGCAPQCTPSSFNNKPQINPRCIDFTEGPSSAGTNSKMTNLNLDEREVLVSKNILSSPEKSTISSPEANIVFSAEGALDSNKNVILNPKSEIVLRLQDNYESDAVFLSPEQESGLKRKYFNWNFKRIRDSFLTESGSKMLSAFSLKVKRENLSAGVIQVQPTRVGDKEKLIISSDSPVSGGCCSSLFVSFKSKHQIKENVPCSMHYKRF